MVLLNVQMRLDRTLLKQFKSMLDCLNNFGITLKNLQVFVSSYIVKEDEEISPFQKTIFESSSVVFDEYVFGVLNLLKRIDRGNIPHYFDTYLNEKFIFFLINFRHQRCHLLK